LIVQQALKFFVPAANSPEEAESVLLSIAKFHQQGVPPHGERLFRIVFRHNGKPYVAQVGQPIDPYFQLSGPVVAIFGGKPLLVCMRDRGVLRGSPIFVGAESVEEAEYFEYE
jgi:hypothetical protein